jgi:hypothetical protein
MDHKVRTGRVYKGKRKAGLLSSVERTGKATDGVKDQ